MANAERRCRHLCRMRHNHHQLLLLPLPLLTLPLQWICHSSCHLGCRIMPSAHYLPLDPRASDADELEVGEEQSAHRTSLYNNQYNIRYHPQPADGYDVDVDEDGDDDDYYRTTTMGMAPRLTRSIPSRRRCWIMPMMLLVPFCVLFIYFMFSSQSLGLGTSLEDVNDDYEPHSGIGKRKTQKLTLIQKLA